MKKFLTILFIVLFLVIIVEIGFLYFFYKKSLETEDYFDSLYKCIASEKLINKLISTQDDELVLQKKIIGKIKKINYLKKIKGDEQEINFDFYLEKGDRVIKMTLNNNAVKFYKMTPINFNDIKEGDIFVSSNEILTKKGNNQKEFKKEVIWNFYKQ